MIILFPSGVTAMNFSIFEKKWLPAPSGPRGRGPVGAKFFFWFRLQILIIFTYIPSYRTPVEIFHEILAEQAKTTYLSNGGHLGC